MELLPSPFQTEHGEHIAKWPVDAEESQAWGGVSVALPLSAAIFTDWHSDSDVQPFVAQVGDELTAYGEIWADEAEQEIELARIIVRPSRRRSGIGCALVARLLKRAKAFGFLNAFVRVVPENVPAIRCYEKAGFVRVSSDDQRRFNKRQPVDYVWLALLMTPSSMDEEPRRV